MGYGIFETKINRIRDIQTPLMGPQTWWKESHVEPQVMPLWNSEANVQEKTWSLIFFKILQIRGNSRGKQIISAIRVAQFSLNQWCVETKFAGRKNTVWERLKAEHLGETTKIFSHLDEVLRNYRFTSDVVELSCHLKDELSCYCFVFNKIEPFIRRLQKGSQRRKRNVHPD